MNWLNLHVSVLDSEDVCGCEPVERATWLFLLRYCVGQENGGRIANCREWKDRKWQQVVRVTGREVNAECSLWHWDGNDLVVCYYPTEKEDELRKKRETASDNGRKGGRPPKKTNAGTKIGTTGKTNVGTNEKSYEKPTLVILEKAEIRNGGNKEWRNGGNEEIPASGVLDFGDMFHDEPEQPPATPPQPSEDPPPDRRFHAINQAWEDVFREATGEEPAITNRDRKALSVFLKSWRGTADEFLETYHSALVLGLRPGYVGRLRSAANPWFLCQNWNAVRQDIAAMDSAPQPKPKTTQFKNL